MGEISKELSTEKKQLMVKLRKQTQSQQDLENLENPRSSYRSTLKVFYQRSCIERAHRSGHPKSLKTWRSKATSQGKNEPRKQPVLIPEKKKKVFVDVLSKGFYTIIRFIEEL